MAPQKKDNLFKIGQGVLTAVVIGYLNWNVTTLMQLQKTIEKNQETLRFNALDHLSYETRLGTLQNKQDNHEGRIIQIEAALPWEERKRTTR